MNACVKCLYCYETEDPYDHYHVRRICMRPTKKIDLVTGNIVPKFVGCYTERSRIGAFFGGCGPSGKFFVKRPVVKLNQPGKE